MIIKLWLIIGGEWQPVYGHGCHTLADLDAYQKMLGSIKQRWEITYE